VTRGSVVEAVHTIHAVAVRDGQIVAEAGDPQILTFLRSSAKPIQALMLVRAYPELSDREIAIACASHLAHPEQLAAVRALLAEVAAAAEVERDDIPVAIDGCGVPTFALPLDRCAHAFARLPVLEGGVRVIAAVRNHPEMLRGPIAADAIFIRELDGWAAKGGAEGLFCACSPDGLGVALKVEDEAFRAIRPALAAFLGRLGITTGELGFVTIESSYGETVGELRTRPQSRVPKSGSRR